MTEEKRRELTSVEKEEITKSLNDSLVKQPILEWKLEHAKLMLSKGLEMNYLEAKMKLESDIAQLEKQVKYETKFQEAYKEILEKGITVEKENDGTSNKETE